MAKDEASKVHYFEGGEVAVWYDGCICTRRYRLRLTAIPSK